MTYGNQGVSVKSSRADRAIRPARPCPWHYVAVPRRKQPRRPLVIDQSLAQIRLEACVPIGFRRFAPRPRSHVRRASCRDTPDHGRFAHTGAFVDHSLNHLGINVEAVRDDQIILPADQGQEPGMRRGAQVAGVEPTGNKRLARGVGLAPVLAEQVRPAQAEPSRPRRQPRQIRRPGSLASRCRRAARRRSPRPGAIERQARDDMSLGHPVAVDDGRAQNLLQLGKNLGADGRRAACE